jgi:hypothetical protein
MRVLIRCVRCRLAAVLSGVLLLGACSMAVANSGGTGSELRPPEDTPIRFAAADGNLSEESCVGTMIDPRDQTALRLFRSVRFGVSYLGDYDVPTGRYGVQRGELLRIDCGTGEPLGIVRT